MSCSIHLYCEKKIQRDGKDVWWCCDTFSMNPYYGLDVLEEEYEHNSICRVCDYDLFGLLAGVRNTEYPPIVEPRGLPDDLSNYVRFKAIEQEGDAHTHSYITAAELFDYVKKHPNNFPYTLVRWLVKKIKKMMKTEFDIFSFYSKIEQKKMLKDHADAFRIVFWFDN